MVLTTKEIEKVKLSFLHELENGRVAKAKDYEKNGISKEEFYNVIWECQSEGYIDGATFSCGGKGNSIQVAFFDHCKLTEKGRKYLKESSKAMKIYRGLKELKSWNI